MANVDIAFLVPTILFMVIVAPIWLVLHYRSKNKETTSLSDEQYQLLEQLARSASTMEERLNALEKILDAEDPTWKEKIK